MNLAQGAALAESLSREARLPPERLFVKGVEFGMTRHPGTDFQHLLGHVVSQVGVKENRGRGQARRQGQDDLLGAKLGSGLSFQLADTYQGAVDRFFDLTDRVIESDGFFRDFLREFFGQCRHTAVKPPGKGFHNVTPDVPHVSHETLKTAHALFIMAVPLETQVLNEARHFRVNLGPIPGGAEIGEKPLVFRA